MNLWLHLDQVLVAVKSMCVILFSKLSILKLIGVNALKNQ